MPTAVVFPLKTCPKVTALLGSMWGLVSGIFKTDGVSTPTLLEGFPANIMT